MTQNNNTPKEDLNKLTPYQMAILAILSTIAILIFALIFVLLRLPDQTQTQTIAPTVSAPTLQPQILVNETPTMTIRELEEYSQMLLNRTTNISGTAVIKVEAKEFIPDATEQIQIDKAIEDFKKNLPTRPK